MGFFDDIGGHFDTFFNRTLPSVGRDVGGAVSGVWHDVLGLGKDVIHVPGDIVKSITPITENVLNKAATVSTTVVKDLTSTVQQTVTQTAKSFFESPMVIVAGIGALLFLTRGSGGGRLGF